MRQQPKRRPNRAVFHAGKHEKPQSTNDPVLLLVEREFASASTPSFRAGCTTSNPTGETQRESSLGSGEDIRNATISLPPRGPFTASADQHEPTCNSAQRGQASIQVRCRCSDSTRRYSIPSAICTCGGLQIFRRRSPCNTNGRRTTPTRVFAANEDVILGCKCDCGYKYSLGRLPACDYQLKIDDGQGNRFSDARGFLGKPEITFSVVNTPIEPTGENVTGPLEFSNWSGGTEATNIYTDLYLRVWFPLREGEIVAGPVVVVQHGQLSACGFLPPANTTAIAKLDTFMRTLAAQGFWVVGATSQSSPTAGVFVAALGAAHSIAAQMSDTMGYTVYPLDRRCALVGWSDGGQYAALVPELIEQSYGLSAKYTLDAVIGLSAASDLHVDATGTSVRYLDFAGSLDGDVQNGASFQMADRLLQDAHGPKGSTVWMHWGVHGGYIDPPASCTPAAYSVTPEWDEELAALQLDISRVISAGFLRSALLDDHGFWDAFVQGKQVNPFADAESQAGFRIAVLEPTIGPLWFLRFLIADGVIVDSTPHYTLSDSVAASTGTIPSFMPNQSDSAFLVSRGMRFSWNDEDAIVRFTRLAGEGADTPTIADIYENSSEVVLRLAVVLNSAVLPYENAVENTDIRLALAVILDDGTEIWETLNLEETIFYPHEVQINGNDAKTVVLQTIAIPLLRFSDDPETLARVRGAAIEFSRFENRGELFVERFGLAFLGHDGEPSFLECRSSPS